MWDGGVYDTGGALQAPHARPASVHVWSADVYDTEQRRPASVHVWSADVYDTEQRRPAPTAAAAAAAAKREEEEQERKKAVRRAGAGGAQHAATEVYDYVESTSRRHSSSVA